MIFEVLVHQLDQGGVVATVFVQPEDGRHTGGACAGNSQLDPVLDWLILGLGGAPDIVFFHVVGEQNLARAVADLDGTRRRDLEGLVVGAVFLGLLCHQADVRHGTQGGWVVLAVFLRIFDNGLVDTGVRGIWDNRQGILGLVVLVPHLAAGLHHRWHGGIDDDIRWNVQSGNALVRVDVSQRATVFLRLLEGLLDLVAVVELVQVIQDVAQAVFAVEAGFDQLVAVLIEHLVEVRADDMAEQDWVGDLHHGRLQVRREQQVIVLGKCHLLAQEVIESLGGHESSVDDLAVFDLQAFLEHLFRAVSAFQHKLELVGTVDDDGFLIVGEVVVAHGGDRRLGICWPVLHGVWVLLSEVLHGLWCTAVGVTLTQHWVHGRTLDRVVALTNVFFFRVGRLVWVIRKVVAVFLELLDGIFELHQGSRNVWQLDDVGLWLLCQFTELCQGVVHLLVFAQAFRELRDDAARQRDIGGFDINVRGGSKSLHYWLERIGCQQWGFVGTGPNNFRHLRLLGMFRH